MPRRRHRATFGYHALEQPLRERWLQSHFGCSLNNDAVIGDLDAGISVAALQLGTRRQVLTTIPWSLWNQVTAHKFLTLEAVLLGWCQFLALGYGLVHWYSRTKFGAMSPMLLVPPPHDGRLHRAGSMPGTPSNRNG